MRRHPELCTAVARTVLEGVIAGFQMTEDATDTALDRSDAPTKRTRTHRPDGGGAVYPAFVVKQTSG